MHPFEPQSVFEQLTAHLRNAIISGEIVDTMPGIRRLANELSVSSNTVTAAIQQLEYEGFLINQGQGKCSRVMIPDHCKKPAFRVTVLPYEPADMQLDYAVELQRRLREDGHKVQLARKSLVELGMSVSRVAHMVKRTDTDAWVVFSSPQEILEWFVKQSIPTFALFGRFRRLPIAATGLNKAPAFRAAIRRLAELGHRRIVLLQPKHNRYPSHALLVRESLEEMELQGIKTGPYNLPDWEQTPLGLRERLDALFSVSPPTAMILDRPNELLATQLYLAQKGIYAPRDISLISDDDPAFEWCFPQASCISWKSMPWVSRIAKWVANISNGQTDLRQTFTQAQFIDRGTIGPVPPHA